MPPLRPRTLPTGFIPPCLPTKAPRPPAGAVWLHEIKHDGFRVIARKDGARVWLYSRPGNDLTRQKAPRIAPLPKWKVDLVEEAIKLIEEEVGGPATAEIIGRRIPAFPIEDIRNAMAQLKKFG
jgi:ATP-dependent DNA ligase